MGTMINPDLIELMPILARAGWIKRSAMDDATELATVHLTPLGLQRMRELKIIFGELKGLDQKHYLALRFFLDNLGDSAA